MAFTKFTEEEFRLRYGISLSDAIPDDEEPGTKVDRRILLTVEKIEEYVYSRMPNFDIDSLTLAQETYVNKAAMEQLKYELNETDDTHMSGFNAFTGSMIPVQEIDKIVICRSAKNILANHIITNGWH